MLHSDFRTALRERMYRHETAQLHALARDPAFRLVPTTHAAQRMAQWGIARFEVERVLKAGAVVMIERDPDGKERWRVAGHDADGRRIDVVIEPRPPGITALVTVIAVE
jgi:Domain of unknown function (DUF4258)